MHLHAAMSRVARAFEAFFRAEAAGGVSIMLAAIVALIWANSPWSESYAVLWSTHVRIGAATVGLEKPLVVWINDLLMAVFFLLVGLEVKRELVTGELNTARKAALPAAAALGGMVVPAAVFYLFAGGGQPGRGWAIPMATDIAFALGLARILGARVPAALIVLLTALAVFDDLGAILVIATFYTTDLSWLAHGIAASLTILLIAMNRAGVERPAWYVLAGLPLWVAVLKSGVHATLAGVVVGLCVPARARSSRGEVVAQARVLLEVADEGDDAATQDALAALALRVEESEAPVSRLEHKLLPIVSFVILPMFALANAGIPLHGMTRADLVSPVTLGACVGLLLGKQVGVLGASWLAVRAGLATLPAGLTWRHVHGVSVLAGIGFTMSIFVAGLAYEEGGAFHRQAKLGVLAASVLASILGGGLLMLLPRGGSSVSSSAPAPGGGAPGGPPAAQAS